MAEVRCPCGHLMNVPDHYAGRSLGCPRCHTVGVKAAVVPEPPPLPTTTTTTTTDLDRLAGAAAQFEAARAARASRPAPAPNVLGAALVVGDVLEILGGLSE